MDGIRKYVNPVQLFQELYRLGLTEEQILTTMIQSKSSPGSVLEVGKYKFRYVSETHKFEDNKIEHMIRQVWKGETPEAVLEENRQGETHEANDSKTE